jgi:methanogenic corrinoid protein MtbC1
MTQQWQTQECWRETGAVSAARKLMPRTHARQQQARQQPTLGDSGREALRHAIETNVIPRLLAAKDRLRSNADQREPGRPIPSADDLAAFVTLLLTREPPAAVGFVEAMRSAGISPESIYLDLIAPAARQLGVMWDEDACGFTDVTIGLQSLHAILRRFAPAFAGPHCGTHDVTGDGEPAQRGPRALLVQAPGEQHGLGLSMLVQFFRRDGWNVWSEPIAASADLVDRVRRRSVALVGISIACSARLDALASDIQAIRRHSQNQAVAIMVGGPIFIEHPQLAAMVGADATAKDGRDAVRQAARLISPSAKNR